MATYSLHDALRLPGLVSMTRMPLAFAFMAVAHRPAWGTAVIGIAALSDVADGWVARRRHEETPTGAALDALMDKVFVVSVLSSLYALRAVTLPEALLVAARDLGELPLVVRLAMRQKGAFQRERRANGLGKLATVMQVLTVGALLWRLPHRTGLVFATACVGLVATASYWAREERDARA